MVVADRDGGDLARTKRLGAARFEHAVRRQIIKAGNQKPCMRIVTKLFAALADPAGVTAHRAGAMERVQLLLQDWTYAHQRLADTETRMLGSVQPSWGPRGVVPPLRSPQGSFSSHPSSLVALRRRRNSSGAI